MRNRRKLFIIILACLLAVSIALSVVNIVQIAGLKNVIAGMEWDIVQLQIIAADGMGLREGVYDSLPYRLYVPDGESETYPLVLFLHGAGSRQGSDNSKQVIGNSFLKIILSEDNLEKYPCVVLIPQCPEGMGWVRQPWGPGIAEDLMGMLEQVCAQYPVDRSRIYVTGNSMGGFGTWGMLREYPDYFAAAVPICGGWDLPDDIENAPVMKDVPIWAFHGALDTAVPVERTRDMVEALEAVGGNIKYTEYPDEGHSISARVYYDPELFPWLFAQSKSEAPPVDPVAMMAGDVYETLPYRIYAPYIPDGDAKLPLVLFLHGSGNKGDDNLSQIAHNPLLQVLLSPENLAEYPCVVIAPQCPVGQRWVRGHGQYDLPGNTEVLMDLLEYIRIAYNTDPDRIYITGLSMGAFGAWGMLRAYPDYFAAAVPICGGWDLPDDLENAPRMKDTPIWVFHGALDDDVPVERSREMVQVLEAAGGSVKYTEYPDEGHACWDRAYHDPALLPWLFGQVRGGA